MTEKSVLCKQDVYTALYGIHEKEVDVIFADPPYQEEHYERLLGVLKDMSYVSDDTLIVLESELNKDFSFASTYGFRVIKEKCYKTNKHVFLERV